MTHICQWPLYEYEYKGRTWRFELTPIGPPFWPIRKDGQPYTQLPSPLSEFWEAIVAWLDEPDIEKYRAGTIARRSGQNIPEREET